MKKVLILVVLFACVFFVAHSEAQEPQTTTISPKQVKVDSNYDGRVDRIEFYDSKGQVSRVEVDANADGVMEEVVIYEGGKPARSERDTNGDGKPDVWLDY